MTSPTDENTGGGAPRTLATIAGRPLHYRPFLSTKAAERRAITNLDAATAQAITPVYVVTPRDWDYENNCHRRSFDEHID